VVAKQVKAQSVGGPQTLFQAHDDVMKRRPSPNATLVVQRKFHQDNKRLYETVSDIDRAHHHEILYWVAYERQKVEELTELIRRGQVTNNPQ
jgi:hypothetical protein